MVDDTLTKSTPLAPAPKLDNPGIDDAARAGTVAGAKNRAGDEDNDRDARLRDAESASTEASEARVRLDDARKRAADSHLTDEQRELSEAHQAADDAEARAVEARRAAGAQNPRTVAEARVAAPVDPNLEAGHYRAQKFGNDPENPKPYKAEHEDPDQQTVRMTLRSPDTSEPREAWVHPDMVGNYARAGWERDAR